MTPGSWAWLRNTGLRERDGSYRFLALGWQGWGEGAVREPGFVPGSE